MSFFRLLVFFSILLAALCNSFAGPTMLQIKTTVAEAEKWHGQGRYDKAEKLLSHAIKQIEKLGPELKISLAKPLASLASAQFRLGKEALARKTTMKAITIAQAIGNDGLLFELSFVLLEKSGNINGAVHMLREYLAELEEKEKTERDDELQTKKRMLVALRSVLGRHATQKKNLHTALLHYQKAHKLAKELQGQIKTTDEKQKEMMELIPIVFAQTGIAATFIAMKRRALAKRYLFRLGRNVQKARKYPILNRHIALMSAKQLLSRMSK